MELQLPQGWETEGTWPDAKYYEDETIFFAKHKRWPYMMDVGFFDGEYLVRMIDVKNNPDSQRLAWRNPKMKVTAADLDTAQEYMLKLMHRTNQFVEIDVGLGRFTADQYPEAGT